MTQFASDFFNKNRKYLNLLSFSPIKLAAFTLAEVLIVLGIIGIVAELTIPDLIQNTQKAEFLAKMKKEYSVISQAQLQLASDNGGDFVGALSNCTGDGYAATNCLRDVLASKIKSTQKCDATHSLGYCFPSSIKWLNNQGYNGGFYGEGASMVIQDGSSYLMWLDSYACNIDWRGPADTCGWITIDVNGMQSPNTWGKDIYEFFIYSNTIKPVGSVGDIYADQVSTDCSSTGTGQLCAAKYLMGGTSN